MLRTDGVLLGKYDIINKYSHAHTFVNLIYEHGVVNLLTLKIECF